jgi:hypothetical protein
MPAASNHPILSAATLGLVLTLATPAAASRPGATGSWIDTATQAVAHFVGLDRLQGSPLARQPVRLADGPVVSCAFNKDPNGLCVVGTAIQP